MEPRSPEFVPEPFGATDVRQLRRRSDDSRAAGGEVQGRPDHIATVVSEKNLLHIGERTVRVAVEGDRVTVALNRSSVDVAVYDRQTGRQAREETAAAEQCRDDNQNQP